jgi:hypothetical protein
MAKKIVLGIILILVVVAIGIVVYLARIFRTTTGRSSPKDSRIRLR